MARRRRATGVSTGAVIGLVIAALIIGGALGYGGTQFLSENRVVAVVNGEKIAKQELWDAMWDKTGQSSLDKLIDDILIKQEAERLGVEVTSEDIDAELQEIKDQFSTEYEYQMALANAGVTEEELRESLKTAVLIEKILGPTIDPSHEELQEYFDDYHAVLFDTPEEVHARHILVETEEEAEEILAQLEDGGEFAVLAREKSTDEASAEAGGDLGFFPRGKMTGEFETAVFDEMEIGELKIVETDFGFHVIELLEKQEAEEAVFDEIIPEVRQSYIGHKVRGMRAGWLESLREQADITLNI